MEIAKTHVILTIISVCQCSALKHAWDTGHNAQIAAIRGVVLRNLRPALTTAPLSIIGAPLPSGHRLP